MSEPIQWSSLLEKAHYFGCAISATVPVAARDAAHTLSLPHKLIQREWNDRNKPNNEKKGYYHEDREDYFRHQARNREYYTDIANRCLSGQDHNAIRQIVYANLGLGEAAAPLVNPITLPPMRDAEVDRGLAETFAAIAELRKSNEEYANKHAVPPPLPVRGYSINITPPIPTPKAPPLPVRGDREHIIQASLR